MARHKNANWNLPDDTKTWDQVNAAILMDIRDELRALNRVMACPNVQAGFIALQQIARDTKRLDRRAKRKAMKK